MSTFATRSSADEALVHVLLDDILILIFVQLSRRHTGDFYWRSRPPWVISTVCKRWRALAVSTPSLWTEVVFHPYWTGQDHPKLASQHEGIEVQLLRAQDCALDVTIDIIDMIQLAESHTAPTSISGQFRALKGKIHHSHTFTIHGDSSKLPLSWTRPSDHAIAPIFNSLESLTFDQSSWMDAFDILSAPVLVDVTLEKIELTCVSSLAWETCSV